MNANLNSTYAGKRASATFFNPLSTTNGIQIDPQLKLDNLGWKPAVVALNNQTVLPLSLYKDFLAFKKLYENFPVVKRGVERKMCLGDIAFCPRRGIIGIIQYGDESPEQILLNTQLCQNHFFKEFICQLVLRLELAKCRDNECYSINYNLLRYDSDFPGLPIHKDSSRYTLICLVDKFGITGGENTIYSPLKRPLLTISLNNPLDTILFEDNRCFHDVNAIQVRKNGHRDVLIISTKANKMLLPSNMINPLVTDHLTIPASSSC